MTPRKVLRLFASVAGIWVMAVAPTAARAQAIGDPPGSEPPGTSLSTVATSDDGSFVYQLSGAADGIRLTYDREAFLPFTPIADLRVPSARATLDSTPVTTVRSAVADPGLFGSLGSALPVLGLPGGLVPAWPLYADANFPSGPADAVAGAGTDRSVPIDLGLLHGQSHAELDHGTGRSRVAGTELKGIVDTDGIASDVDVKREGTHLIARAQTSLSGVDLLSGLVHFESLGSVVTLDWPSPQEKAVVTKTIEAAGMTVAGLPIPTPKDLQSKLGETITKALQSIGGKQFTIGFQPRVTEGDGAVEISALEFFVDGKVLPAFPPFLNEENDRAYVELGVTSLTYQAELFDFAVSPPSGGTDLVPPLSDEYSAAPSASGEPSGLTDESSASGSLDGPVSSGFASGSGSPSSPSSPSSLSSPPPSSQKNGAGRAPSTLRAASPAALHSDLADDISRRIGLLGFIMGPAIIALPGVLLYGRFVVAPPVGLPRA
jgi:hypothetical protein